MTKKLGIIIASIVAVAILSFIIFKWNTTPNEPKLSAAEISDLVSSQYPGKVSEPQLVADADKPIYEVTSDNGEKSYIIKIDGNTGEVLNINMVDMPPDDRAEVAKDEEVTNESTESNDVNKENDNETNNKNTEEGQDGNNQGSTTNAVIGLDAAKKIAIEQFTGTIEKIELDEDDGRLSYEVEMINQNQEAEILIDAYTGEIILLVIENDND